MMDFFRIDSELFIMSESKWNEELDELKSGQSLCCSEAEKENRIRKLERFKELLVQSLENLPEMELDALEIFYGKMGVSEKEQTFRNVTCKATHKKNKKELKKAAYEAVQDYLEKYRAERTTVYRKRGSGLQIIREFLAEQEVDNELSEFYRFDIDGFLKEFPLIEKEYAHIACKIRNGYNPRGCASVGGSHPKYSVSDPTGNAVVWLDKMNAELNRLGSIIDLVENALDSLDTREREIVEVIALPKGRNKYRTKDIRYEEFALEKHMCQSNARTLYRRGKYNMGKYIERTIRNQCM